MASINPTSPGSSFPSAVSISNSGFGVFLATFEKVGSYTITVGSGSFSGSVTVTPGPAVKLGFRFASRPTRPPASPCRR